MTTPDPSRQKLKELLRRIEQLPVDARPEPPRPASPRATFIIEPGQKAIEALPTGFPSMKVQAQKSSLTRIAMVIAGLATALGLGGLFVLNQQSTETKADANLHRTEIAAGADKAGFGTDAPAQSQETVAPTQIAQATSGNAGHVSSQPPATNAPSLVTTKLVVPSMTTGSRQRSVMAIRSEPPLPLDSQLQFRIRLLPSGLTLSRGTRVGTETWAVTIPEMSGLELVAGDVQPGRFSLLVELVSVDGLVVAATDGQVTVTGQVPLADTERLSEEELAKLLGQGLLMLGSGNVNSARLLLLRAADSGNARAALILGDTYDAERLTRIGAASVVPDRDKAAFWYSRADELGASEAKERLLQMNAR